MANHTLRDTVPFMTSEDPKERLFGEWLQLNIRLDELINRHHEEVVGNFDELVDRMRGYDLAIRTRALIEGVSLDPADYFV